MPAKDIYHDAVKNALIKDGWKIIADPYFLQYEDAELYADLFVEKALLVEQEGRKIVVEIKSFISPSLMKDFENALGQYILYRDILKLANKDYKIYLAIRDTIFDTFFQRKSIQAVVKRNQIEFIIFNNEREEITLWIN
ncbi:fdxN element excision controlling factor XisH-like protein [Tolypothrix tenuis PCC 7101]|uniref:FdxN element excision controlling factor XisH-like protein n=1 Tax=Tolypothrix tenuis PCC 7101 TaxID=231146 RepID=A0A1Z4MSM1_9CYAN|nr:XisH family protein [Aulosira sp. FACHB-113]BAY96447.1 fdxN element excision controlling factor XisH-like protein [Tolypothrix tenuis PCC 7101]BAZ73045.1 fdxN element excision controlling factor XisH-like protein [Aulosira laxa NIES-50]